MNPLMMMCAIAAACLPMIPQFHTSPAAAPAHAYIRPLQAPANLFTSNAGRFSVALPDGYPAMSLEVSDVPSELGELKLYMYTSVDSEHGVCLVGYSDVKTITMSDGVKQEMLEGAQEGALSNMNATLVSEEEITLDGNPGRSIRFISETEEMNLRGRMDYYIVGRRMYQVGFIEIADGALESDGVSDYFASFKLIPTAKKSKKRK